MKTLDVEIAMIKTLDHRTNMIVPNVSFGIWFPGYGALHECDLLMLNPRGYATEIEIKVSKSDLLKDKKKKHTHDHQAIKNLYYAVPVKLKEVALKEIPERAGLYIIHEDPDNFIYAELVRYCKPISKPIKWTDEYRIKLGRLGTMRILLLKEKLTKLYKEKNK